MYGDLGRRNKQDEIRLWDFLLLFFFYSWSFRTVEDWKVLSKEKLRLKVSTKLVLPLHSLVTTSGFTFRGMQRQNRLRATAWFGHVPALAGPGPRKAGLVAGTCLLGQHFCYTSSLPSLSLLGWSPDPCPSSVASGRWWARPGPGVAVWLRLYLTLVWVERSQMQKLGERVSAFNLKIC